jgi:hypothetical protein
MVAALARHGSVTPSCVELLRCVTVPKRPRQVGCFPILSAQRRSWSFQPWQVYTLLTGQRRRIGLGGAGLPNVYESSARRVVREGGYWRSTVSLQLSATVRLSGRCRCACCVPTNGSGTVRGKRGRHHPSRLRRPHLHNALQQPPQTRPPPRTRQRTSGVSLTPARSSSDWAALTIGSRCPKSGESALTSAATTICLVGNGLRVVALQVRAWGAG